MKIIFSLFVLICSSCYQLMAQVEIITWRGWNDCFRISNSRCEVIIGASCGGRVLSFSLNGNNIIFENPSQNGKALIDFINNPFDPDGGRFDYGPERTTRPLHSVSWMGTWKAEIIDNYAVRLTSEPDTLLGMLSIREFILDKDSALLTINQSGTNISGRPMKRHFWGRTLLKPGGLLFMPVSPESRFKYGWGRFFWNPDKIESPDSTDSRININNNTYSFHAIGSTIKGGTDATEGWMAYDFNGLLFLKLFGVYSDHDYSGSDYMTGIFYCNDKFLEMEPCSPTWVIQPGARICFSERWILEERPSSEKPYEIIKIIRRH